jgi:hypothetical protein
MQFCRPRLPEDAVPRAGPKPDDAGKSSLQVTKFHGAHQRAEISAQRAQGGAIFRARIERRDEEDRGASKRRGYCLREDSDLPATSGVFVGSGFIGRRFCVDQAASELPSDFSKCQPN